MRVLIIGAGLGGLGLAHRLLRSGFEVTVFERDDGIEARFQGYRIGIGGAGLVALRECVPERLLPLLDAVSGELSGVGRSVDAQLNVLGEVPVQHEGTLFDRHVLRCLLLAGLDAHVRFGAKLEHYTELPDGRVRAHFADGTAETGDLLVGADGAGSLVRRLLLPEIAVHSVGTAGAIGRTPLTERFAGLVPGWSTMVNTPELQLFLGKMAFRTPPERAAAELAPDIWLPPTPSYLRWVMLMPEARLRELGVPTEFEGTGPLLELIPDWHPELRALLEHADQHNSGVGPLRSADPLQPWPTRPVTLLGDAGHPAPPGGLGAHLAFLDGAALANRLNAVRTGAAELLPALADYEHGLRDSGTESIERARDTLRSFDDLRREAPA